MDKKDVPAEPAKPNLPGPPPKPEPRRILDFDPFGPPSLEPDVAIEESVDETDI